jgi:hypothetical protein
MMKAERKAPGTYSVEGLTEVDEHLVRALGDAEGNAGLLTFVRRLAARAHLRDSLQREPTPAEVAALAAQWRGTDGLGL